jgi:AraC-like DNA-binding protein
VIAAHHLILREMSLRPSGEWTPGGEWTVVRAAEGAGYCLQTGAARELNPGDAMVLGPNAAAVFRASQLGVLKLEYFQVLPQCLNGLLTVQEWRLLEDATSPVTMRLLHFTANDPTAQKFTRLAAQPQRDGLAVRSALLQLWSASVTCLLPAAGTAAMPGNLRERFRQFVGKMSEAELAVRPLTQLAEELHCSERHFSRLFREEFNISLRARQTELRLQRARQLLADSDAKIINVAFESGYRHLGLFNALFKRRFGVTPSQWRHQNLPPAADTSKRPGSGLLPMLLLALGLATQ